MVAISMKGVILAGGKGSRLLPLTKITNKHLLPIFNRLMIEYPLNTLLNPGIREILIISGREHAGDFIEYLGSGKEFKAKFTYKVQEEAGGIAQALALAEDFANQKPITVILGDNIFDPRFKIPSFEGGARIFIKKVKNPERFGVPVMLKSGSTSSPLQISKILEKPHKAPTQYAVTGLYQYNYQVFDIIKNLKPSARGELEITDVNNSYIQKGLLTAKAINGFWSDAGTFPSLTQAIKWTIKNS